MQLFKCFVSFGQWRILPAVPCRFPRSVVGIGQHDEVPTKLPGCQAQSLFASGLFFRIEEVVEVAQVVAYEQYYFILFLYFEPTGFFVGWPMGRKQMFFIGKGESVTLKVLKSCFAQIVSAVGDVKDLDPLVRCMEEERQSSCQCVGIGLCTPFPPSLFIIILAPESLIHGVRRIVQNGFVYVRYDGIRPISLFTFCR